MMFLRPVLVLSMLAGTAAPLLSQEGEDYQDMSNDEQRGFVVGLVEGQLSTPERQISISNIDGILGSNVTVREITISDQEGVWLRITNAALDWNQGALFFGRLEITSLSAESIEFLRTATPAEGAPVDLPSPEAGGLQIPEFPVAINIGEISVPRVTFGEGVFGLGSEVAVTGALSLEGGNLDADLDITRLDGPGGTLVLDAAFANETETLDLDLTLSEPQNGIIANLLNIEGRPAVELTVAGSGPLSALSTELQLTADSQTVLAGTALVADAEDGRTITLDIDGALEGLVAEPYRPFFGPQTSVSGAVLLRSEGGVRFDALDVSGGQLSFVASGETSIDNFLTRLELDARIADAGGAPVVLPGVSADTTIAGATLSIDYGTGGSDDWSALFDIAAIRAPDFAAERVALDLSGVASNLEDPATRMVTLNGDGTVSGIEATPEIEAALGESVGLGIAAVWNAGEPIELAEFRLAGAALEARLAGTIADFVFDGDIGIETADIAPFSGLAGRDLSGALSLAATGTVSPLIGGFDLTLDGTGTGLAIDDPVADNLLEGEVALAGRLARTETGIEADGFRIGNERIELTADGAFSSQAADFDVALELSDLALVTDQASGAVSVIGRAEGAEGIVDLGLEARIADGRLADRILRNARVGFAGQLAEGGLAGTFEGLGELDGFRVTLASDVRIDEAGNALSGLRFSTAGAEITGDIVQDPEGLLTGQLAIAAPDVSIAAALALLEAEGALNGTIVLAPEDGTQAASVDLTIAGLSAAGAEIGSATLDAEIADLFGVPAIDGAIVASNVAAGGVTLSSLDARASQQAGATRFDAQARLATGTGVDIAGALAPEGDGFRLALERALVTEGSIEARLTAPAELVVAGETVSFDGIDIAVGGGTVRASGSAGETLDIAVTVASLPLAIANDFAPGLGLSGTLNANARISGDAANPSAAFDAQGSGINAAAISGFGIAPVGFTASGRFADGEVSLDALTITDASGSTISGSGTIPLEGPGLGVTVTGSVPLALANQFVADRGGQFSGTVGLNANVTGSIANPQVSGRVTTAGAGYIDPEANLRLVDITTAVALTGESAVIEQFSAGLATGGSISGSGTVGLTGQLPANLALSINSARYADGTLLVATASGALTVTGNLLGNPLIAGNVLVEEANIGVPDVFGSGTALIDVTHRNPPPPVRATLDRAGITSTPGGAPAPAARAPGVLLDIALSAPNQIFVRGRGLDAELGGQVRIVGPIANLQPVGAFNLLRGRLAILGQRIDFEEGAITLVGDLDPQIRLVARTQGDGITVFVTVSGRVSDIAVEFSSNPQLPQDEVLARLLFNRSIGELSPLQIARLAAAAAELAGGGPGPSIFDSLRDGIGFADLDVVTDQQGNVGVQAGTYIEDNIYLGVGTGAGGQGRVSINLDLTDDITVTGAASSSGDTSVGVFFERDY